MGRGYTELRAFLAMTPGDVGNEAAEFRIRAVMAVRVCSRDGFPRVEFHGVLQI